MVYLAIKWWIFPWQTVSHNQMVLFSGHPGTPTAQLAPAKCHSHWAGPPRTDGVLRSLCRTWRSSCPIPEPIGWWENGHGMSWIWAPTLLSNWIYWIWLKWLIGVWWSIFNVSFSFDFFVCNLRFSHSATVSSGQYSSSCWWPTKEAPKNIKARFTKRLLMWT